MAIYRVRERYQSQRHRRRWRRPPAVRWVYLVCAYYHLEPEQLRSRSKATRLVRSRWVAMQLMVDEQMSLQATAEQLGLCDHTTVLNGLARVAADPSLQAEVRAIRRSQKRVVSYWRRPTRESA